MPKNANLSQTPFQSFGFKYKKKFKIEILKEFKKIEIFLKKISTKPI